MAYDNSDKLIPIRQRHSQNVGQYSEGHDNEVLSEMALKPDRAASGFSQFPVK